jgi:hypothetical protein
MAHPQRTESSVMRIGARLFFGGLHHVEHSGITHTFSPTGRLCQHAFVRRFTDEWCLCVLCVVLIFGRTKLVSKVSLKWSIVRWVTFTWKTSGQYTALPRQALTSLCTLPYPAYLSGTYFCGRMKCSMIELFVWHMLFL